MEAHTGLLYVRTEDNLPFAVSFSSLPTTTKAALPAPTSQEVGGSSCGRRLGSMQALDISSSRILMHSNSWSGLPAFPTTGNHSPSTSAIGIPTFSDNECVSRSGFSDGCDARVVGAISLDTTWSALFRALMVATIPVYVWQRRRAGQAEPFNIG